MQILDDIRSEDNRRRNLGYFYFRLTYTRCVVKPISYHFFGFIWYYWVIFFLKFFDWIDRCICRLHIRQTRVQKVFPPQLLLSNISRYNTFFFQSGKFGYLMRLIQLTAKLVEYYMMSKTFGFYEKRIGERVS